MGVISILNSLIGIYLLLIPGFIFAKKKVLTEEQISGLCSVILYLTWPCMVINALQLDFSKEVITNVGRIILIAVAVLVIAFILSQIVAKAANLQGGRRYLFTYMLTFANTGFMGLPIIRALYSGEALFYAATYDTTADIFIFTVGIMLVQKSGGGYNRKLRFKDMISPGLIALLIGMALFLLQIKLPTLLKDTIATIGSSTSLLAMFYLGYRLGAMNIRDMLGDKDAYLLSALKLLVMPITTFLLIKIFVPDPGVMWEIILMQIAMPPATSAAIMASKYQGDVDFASKGVLLATTLSILTIPIFAILAHMF